MASSVVKEARTGKELPSSTEAAGLLLAALGARTATVAFVRLNPYAVGIYVDRDGARGLKGDNLDATAAAFIASRNVRKSILLVFTRTTKGSTTAKAMSDRLKDVTDRPAVDMFIAQCQPVSFKDGDRMQIDFVGDTITTTICGTAQQPIRSERLCCALLQLYIDCHIRDPVDPQLIVQLHEFVCAAAAAPGT